MAWEAVFVVGLVVELGALVVLAVEVARLRARGRRMAREVNDLSRTVATVQDWAVQEIRALRDAQRVDASAAALLEQMQNARAAPPAPAPKPDDDPITRRESVAPSQLAALEQLATGENAPGVAVAAVPEEEPTTFLARAKAAARGSEEETKLERPTTPPDVAEYSKVVAASREGDAAEESDNEETSLWEEADLRAALNGAEAGGATRPPLATPRAALSAPVAPSASASLPLPPEPAPNATSLAWRPQSPHGARPPKPPHRTATIAGMPAVQTRAPTDALEEQPGEPRDTLTMHPGSKPGDDGELTDAWDVEPPMYAQRPPEQGELRGVDGVPDATPGRKLGPDEETPRKYRLTTLEAGK